MKQTSSSSLPENDQLESKEQMLLEMIEKIDLAQIIQNVKGIPSYPNTNQSYDQLYEIARSIIALNVGKDFPQNTKVCSEIFLILY